MSYYSTHENTPFTGALSKIRITSYRFNDSFANKDEVSQLLEITKDGAVSLNEKDRGTQNRTKLSIPASDAEYIFAAFADAFSRYKKDRRPSDIGYYRVRLLTDTNDVFFYYGSNGQDYIYNGKTLTEILREKTGIDTLFALNAKADARSKIAEIIAKYTNDRASVYETLLVNVCDGYIQYASKNGKKRRTYLQVDAPDKVVELLERFDETTIQNRDERDLDSLAPEFALSVTYDSGVRFAWVGNVTDKPLPEVLLNLAGSVRDIIHSESLGVLFAERKS